MRFKILLPVLAVFVMQSCTERVDEAESKTEAVENVNTNVPADATYTGAEPAAAAPDVKDANVEQNNAAEASTLHQNMKSTARNSNNNRATTPSSKKQTDVAYVNTKSQNTPGFTAEYQVPPEQYAAEAKAAKESTKKRATEEESVYHKRKVIHGNMYATYDEPGDVYDGEEVLSNDGVEKNRKRNINYLDFSVSKAPSDGGSFDKK